MNLTLKKNVLPPKAYVYSLCGIQVFKWNKCYATKYAAPTPQQLCYYNLKNLMDGKDQYKS